MRHWLALVLVVSTGALADDRADVMAYIDERRDENAGLAMQIYDLAELGYLEKKSSALLQKTLKRAGFSVESGTAGIPTAFVASYGSGTPVIGILAEFDALPGISQAAVPIRQQLDEQPNGHACGHHLFGTGSVSAAVAVKKWMAENRIPGTLRVYGTPAEEGGSGKVYMVRSGLFEDVNAVLHWHAADRNLANPATSLANRSARFTFSGISAHAAAAPHLGRSALDGVESLNFMVNLMREHVPEEARIHYVITKGGEAPNVVPDKAQAYYFVRHPQAATLLKIWDRVIAAAEAAALGTGTSVAVEVMHGNHSLLPNETLARTMHRNLSVVGGYEYTPEEQEFAEKISATFLDDVDYHGLQRKVLPMELERGKGSTDVGDVSWVVPTTGLRTATWVPGTASHSWQAIAAGGTSIGVKGMQVAAKTLALTLMDLLQDSQLITEATDEFMQRRGPGFVYTPLLGDRDPPLDYRL